MPAVKGRRHDCKRPARRTNFTLARQGPSRHEGPLSRLIAFKPRDSVERHSPSSTILAGKLGKVTGARDKILIIAVSLVLRRADVIRHQQSRGLGERCRIDKLVAVGPSPLVGWNIRF